MSSLIARTPFEIIGVRLSKVRTMGRDPFSATTTRPFYYDNSGPVRMKLAMTFCGKNRENEFKKTFWQFVSFVIEKLNLNESLFQRKARSKLWLLRAIAWANHHHVRPSKHHVSSFSRDPPSLLSALRNQPTNTQRQHHHATDASAYALIKLSAQEIQVSSPMMAQPIQSPPGPSRSHANL